MNASNAPVATIAHDDLAALTEVAMMRLPLRAAESRRRGEVGALLASEAELVRSLTAHLQCLRVNCSGSHGSGSLAEATAAVSAALTVFAGELSRLAGDYSRLLRVVGDAEVASGAILGDVTRADAAPTAGSDGSPVAAETPNTRPSVAPGTHGQSPLDVATPAAPGFGTRPRLLA